MCKKAIVGERIGITDVTVNYYRPAVIGREGKIWGTVVQKGYSDFGFGNTKQAPWRAGADENTTIEFSTDVSIEGKDLPAGRYGFFIAYYSTECTIIFSKNSTSWGSFYYDPKEDALRVTVKPLAADRSVERLRYEFTDQTENTAILQLEWEKLIIPLKIEVDYVKTQIASFRRELRGEKAWRWQAWAQAAYWCVKRNTNLDEALLWADSATSVNFGGERSFLAWSTKAQVLDNLGRKDESAETLKKALPLGSLLDLQLYARQLIASKKPKEAFEVFNLNYQRNPEESIAIMGMARGYSALGKFDKALDYARKCLPIAPVMNKQNVENMIKLLENKKDIN